MKSRILFSCVFFGGGGAIRDKGYNFEYIGFEVWILKYLNINFRDEIWIVMVIRVIFYILIESRGWNKISMGDCKMKENINDYN